MKKAVLMLCLLFAGCDEDELSIIRSENIQVSDVSTGAINDSINQSSEVVTPEPSTFALMALCLVAMFAFGKWSYRYRDPDDLTTRGIDP